MVDKNTVERVAALACIGMTEAEKEQMASDLSQVFGWMDQLNEVPTPDDDAHKIDSDMYMRPDMVTDGDIREKILENAPKASHHMFEVPKVIERA